MDTEACRVREELGTLILPGTENAQLCISELTSNVHKHVTNGRTMHLIIHRYEDRVRADVYDESTRMPKIDETLPDLTEDDEGNFVVDEISESGNGMFLVKTLSDDCGWRRLSTAPGKVVWFALNTPARMKEK